MEYCNVRLILARIVSASSFSRSFTASSIVAMICSLGSVLEVIAKFLRPFPRRSIINNQFLINEPLVSYLNVARLTLGHWP